MKVYPEINRTDFEEEKSAFRRLENVPDQRVIHCFGSYTHYEQNPVTHKTHNIILELAETDLYNFFAHNAPPQLPEEIILVWERITDIAHGIHSVHSCPPYNG